MKRNEIAILRSGLREAVRELRETRDKLLELRRVVPVSPPDVSEDDTDTEPDPLAEMAAVIDCGLHDCLEPLIRDFTDAAKYGDTK